MDSGAWKSSRDASLLQLGPEDGRVQVALGREMPVDQRLVHPGPPGDLRRGRAFKSLAGKKFPGRAQDAIPVRSRGCGGVCSTLSIRNKSSGAHVYRRKMRGLPVMEALGGWNFTKSLRADHHSPTLHSLRDLHFFETCCLIIYRSNEETSRPENSSAS